MSSLRLHSAITLILVLSAGIFAQTASTLPPKSYEVVHGWPVLPENDMLDEVSAIAVDSKGNILILTRGGRKWPDNDILDTSPIAKETIFVIDSSTGKFHNAAV